MTETVIASDFVQVVVSSNIQVYRWRCSGYYDPPKPRLAQFGSILNVQPLPDEKTDAH